MPSPHCLLFPAVCLVAFCFCPVSKSVTSLCCMCLWLGLFMVSVPNLLPANRALPFSHFQCGSTSKGQGALHAVAGLEEVQQEQEHPRHPPGPPCTTVCPPAWHFNPAPGPRPSETALRLPSVASATHIPPGPCPHTEIGSTSPPREWGTRCPTVGPVRKVRKSFDMCF